MKILKKFFFNVLLQSFWMFLVLIFLVSAPLVHARVSRVMVAVDGMSCPFCAFGVEKKLKKVGGVGSVAMDLKSGRATLSAIEGETIEVDEIPDAIKRSGFTPGTIQVAASGRISVDDKNRLLFNINGSQQKFLLVNLKNDTKKHLEELAKTDTLVKVAGVFHPHVDDISAIAPERIEEVSK